MILPEILLFARPDYIERGTPEQKRRAEECLFPKLLYRIEIVDQQGVEKVYVPKKKGRKYRTQKGAEWEGTKIVIALKGVKYWWPEEMFTIFDGDGNVYDLRLMQKKKKWHNTMYYRK